MKNLVQILRDRGYSVRVTHYRRYFDWSNKINALNHVDESVTRHLRLVTADIVELPNHESPGLNYALPKGGTTVVEVTTPSGSNYYAEAYCNPKDQFNRKLATTIASNRVLQILKDNHEFTS